MIKRAVVTADTPSLETGERGTVVKKGEAVRPQEDAPEMTERDLAKQMQEIGI